MAWEAYSSSVERFRVDILNALRTPDGERPLTETEALIIDRAIEKTSKVEPQVARDLEKFQKLGKIRVNPEMNDVARYYNIRDTIVLGRPSDWWSDFGVDSTLVHEMGHRNSPPWEVDAYNLRAAKFVYDFGTKAQVPPARIEQLGDALEIDRGWAAEWAYLRKREGLPDPLVDSPSPGLPDGSVRPKPARPESSQPAKPAPTKNLAGK